jgi:hypothetical protein
MRYQKFSLLFLLHFCIRIMNAQESSKVGDNGLVIYKLGSDTTVCQHFNFDKGKFSTSILLLTGKVEKLEGSGILDAAGDIKEVKSTISRLDSLGRWYKIAEGHNIFNGDSTVYTSVSSDGKIFRRAVVGKGIVTNAADACSFYVFPYMGFYAPAKNGDTAFHCQLSFGECREFKVARVVPEELEIGSGVMGKITLFVDNDNRMDAADAIGSSLNFIAKVKRGFKNPEAFIDALAKRRAASNTVAPKIFRDTTVLVLQDKKIETDYWRPYRRNRQIFGAVVPWNRIWRTGANNATQLRTDADLNFNGYKLPAGKYSIWTYPTENNWQLIFNKQADIWGTEYKAESDVMKIPLTVEKITSPVEILKISLLPLDNKKARLQIEWEFYKAWADFTIE